MPAVVRCFLIAASAIFLGLSAIGTFASADVEIAGTSLEQGEAR